MSGRKFIACLALIALACFVLGLGLGVQIFAP